MAFLGFVGGKATLEQLVQAGKAQLTGSPAPLAALKDVIDELPANFEIMKGTQ
jgi:alkyl sulfatase BDS1-like metallo-beta-lactamase superfamily hydrolase